MLLQLLNELLEIKEIKKPWQYFGQREFSFMYRFVRTSNNTSNKLTSQIRRFADDLDLPAYVVARVIIYGEKFSEFSIEWNRELYKNLFKQSI